MHIAPRPPQRPALGLASLSMSPRKDKPKPASSEYEDPAEFRREQGRVVRTQWDDPDDLNVLRRNKRPRQVSGYRVADPLRRMQKRPGSLITEAHIRAADRYRLAFDTGRLGCTADPDRISSRRAGVARTGPSAGELEQARQQRIYEAASKHLGLLAHPLIVHTVLMNRDLKSFCRSSAEFGREIRPDVAMGMLLAMLDRLAEFFGLGGDPAPMGDSEAERTRRLINELVGQRDKNASLVA